MTRRLMIAGLVLAAAAPLRAEDTYRHGRVLSVEPGVTLQRANDPGADEAFPNLPFLPGDRVWTDRGGRAEFQFADGTVLRLDSASKLDYVAHDDGGGDRVVLRLWSGVLYLHNRDGRGAPDFGIETPAGVVEARTRGVYRVDVQADETRLSVYEGSAALEAEREVRASAGERVSARAGEPTDDARGFDRADLDDFDRWDADHQGRQAYAVNRREYLPETVLPYAGELDSYGTWYYQSEIGNVWRPYVAAGWRPYYDGRWVWTAYGWTWVPSETWGWAPFHFGRWEHTPMLGWYWIPGSAWGPAWVSWAVGPDYVGWCPLGHHDRPVTYAGGGGERGNAVPRGPIRDKETPAAWAYVRRADFGSPDLPGKIEQAVPPGHHVQPVEQVHARPSHDLLTVEVGTGLVAAPRNVRARVGPSPTAPEVRGEPAAIAPFPVARRRPAPAEPTTTTPQGEPVRPAETRPAENTRPTDTRPVYRGYVPAAPVARPREAGAPPAGGDREVLRRVFGPLSQPRPAEGPERPMVHTRPGDASPAPSPRAEPRGVQPPRVEPPQPHATPATRPAPRNAVASPPADPAGQSSGTGQAQTRPAQNEKDH